MALPLSYVRLALFGHIALILRILLSLFRLHGYDYRQSYANLLAILLGLIH